MSQWIGVVAVIAVVGVVTLLGLVVALAPKWSDDKPYTDEHGWLVDCGCRGCGR